MNLSANMVSTSNTPQDLLDDVGRFLGETLVGESLSPRAGMQRASLLRRLQPYLRRSRGDVTPILKINSQNAETNGTNHSSLEEEYEELSGRSDDICQVNLSFSELKSTALKHGPLQRKEKGVFSDQWRKYATVLHRHFLYMYSSEHGVKPCASENIKGFIARPVPNPRNEPKKNSIFEIVCPGKTGYQFTARTVKDMNQWVAAICQASVQYIQVSHSPLPDVTTDKSISTEVRDVSVPVHNEDEIYDDAGSVTNFNENAKLRLSDEPYYDDLSITYEGNGRLESNPICEEKCPPLPPRRTPPAVPQDGLSDQESVYHDITVSEQHSPYLNVIGVDGVGKKHTEIRTSTILNQRHKRMQPGTENGHKTLQSSTAKERAHTKIQPGTDSVHTTAQPQQSAKHKMKYNAEENNDEGEQEIYDDIVLGDKSPKAKKSPVLQKKDSTTNISGIKNRAKELEKILSKGGCQPKHKTSDKKKLDVSTLHKPMKNNGKDTLFSLPQMPTASQNSKSDIFDQPLQPTSNLHKPTKSEEKITTVTSSNTPPRKQPPKPPTRSYLMR